MFINILNNFFSKLSRKIPLRLVIIVPFVIEIFAVVGVTGWLSFRNGQEAVDDLASQLRSEITTRIHQHLETHTTMLHRINQINVDAIHLGRLKLEDMQALEQHLWKQIQLFDTVSYVGMGTEQATYVGAQLFDNSGVTFVEVSDQSTGGHLKKWETDNLAHHTKLIQTLPNYNPKNRAWYLSAVKTGNPVWSQAYFSSRRTTLSVSQPIYNNQGKLLAVTIAEVNVFDVSQFLRSLKIGQTGQSFIMERSGFMVGTSASEKPYRKVQTSNQLPNPLKDQNAVSSQTVSQLKQFKAIDSHDAVTRASAHYLTQHFGDLNFIKNKQDMDFIDNGKRHFLKVVPFNDKWGLDWLIVVVVPDTDFMKHIEANMYYTILLCLAALMITIFVGILTGQWIIQPLIHLNTTAKALTKGQWQQMIRVERQDEVGELANSFSRMTTQLQELFTTLEDKNTELQRLDGLKDDFLANTSHELRTPLNGIIGIAGSLIDGSTGQLSPHTCSELSMIVASGQRLSNLVNDILDFSKQKYEQIELELKPVDMRKIADIVFRFCQPLVGQKDLQLANAIANDLPLANADENRVQQILHNLVGNAIKFTERGRIEISAQLPVSNNQLVIIVSDTGVGIPANKTGQIFESYEQLGDSSTSQNGGTGLGLAVTKQLVHLHEGEIWVESTVGVGSRFIFTLPISDKVDVLADKEGINVLG
ncbi:MAG: guanylate cyclase, partial [Gammaproteobacteria bacterium]